MDGDELLAEVRQLHPLTVRIVLTGQCTREAMLRLVRLAHRAFTKKPCDPDALKTAVQRACALRDLLQQSHAGRTCGKSGQPAHAATLYNQIIAELEKPDGSISEVGNMIAPGRGHGRQADAGGGFITPGFAESSGDPAR